MKKNAMLKIAAILMVAVLLTTCAISSTFAKYVTTGSTSSTARVAKWGVNVKVSASDSAFGKTYKLDNDTVVNSSTYVIAPGTSNADAISIEVSGEPEVKSTVDFAYVGDNTKYFALTNWEAGCPLAITVTIDGDSETYTGTAAQIEKSVNDALTDAFVDATFVPGTSEAISKTVKIGWAWDYGDAQTTDTDRDGISDWDEIDTKLGDAAAAGSKVPGISFNFAVTIEQVGEETDAVKVTEAVNA